MAEASAGGPRYVPPSFEGNRVDLGDRSARLIFSVERPRIAMVDDFLSAAECDEIAALAAARLAPATVFAADGTRQFSEWRTGWHAKLARGESPVVRRFEQRAARLVGAPDAHGERVEVIRYTAAQQYRPHYDWFDTATPGGEARVRARGQRVATVIVCLDDRAEGGSTVFTRLGLEVRPRRGAALFFSNVDAAGRPTRLVLHAGEPVTAGGKLIATRWFGDRPQPDD